MPSKWLIGTRNVVPTGTSDVSTELDDSTRRVVVAHTNLRPAFFCRAPGSRPASVRTWNPLQMPTTGPPAAANACTAPITGENRAMAPGRR